MKKESLIRQFKEDLEVSLDKHFPKGKTKARGEALVLFADALVLFQKIIKAFGGCTKCFGKGYGTQTLYSRSISDFGELEEYKDKLPTIVFCDCERGKELEGYWNKGRRIDPNINCKKCENSKNTG